MTEARQYLACTFRPGDARQYTYHNDGEAVAVGDTVKVTDRDGVGWKRVTVAAIVDTAPSFPTKPILGKVEPEPESEPLTEKEDF